MNTQISVPASPELKGIFRAAQVRDAKSIRDLIEPNAKVGLMLPKTLSSLYDTIRDFVIYDVDGEVKGVGALHVLWEDLAEIRSLAVVPECRGQGIGHALCLELLKQAHDLGLNRVFTLTYQESFFGALGFERVDKNSLPHKVWTDCINCPKFPDCDEIAMAKDLS